MDKPLSVDDKFLAQMKKKHETKQVDKPKIEQATMEGIMDGILQVPEKLHMVSSPDKPSVKKAKEGENQLHTGNGKSPANTMNKEY